MPMLVSQVAGAPVAPGYHERASFEFNGKIEKISIKYI